MAGAPHKWVSQQALTCQPHMQHAASFLWVVPDCSNHSRCPLCLQDVTFHQCVNLGRFNTEKVVSFVPPDGEFDLMKYRCQEGISLPFRVLPIINEMGRTRMEVGEEMYKGWTSAGHLRWVEAFSEGGCVSNMQPDAQIYCSVGCVLLLWKLFRVCSMASFLADMLHVPCMQVWGGCGAAEVTSACVRECRWGVRGVA